MRQRCCCHNLLAIRRMKELRIQRMPSPETLLFHKQNKHATAICSWKADNARYPLQE